MMMGDDGLKEVVREGNEEESLRISMNPVTTTTSVVYPVAPPQRQVSGREARRSIVSERKRQREEMEREKKELERIHEAEKARKRRLKLEQQKGEQKEARRIHEEAKWYETERKSALKAVQNEAKVLKKKYEDMQKEVEKREQFGENQDHMYDDTSTDGQPAFVEIEAFGLLPFEEGGEYMDWGLLVWECANSLSDELGLAKFTIDHFANAVKEEKVDSVLLIEVARRLLKFALSDKDVQLLDESEIQAVESVEDDEDPSYSEEEEEDNSSDDSEDFEDDDDDYSEEETAGYRSRKAKSTKKKGSSTSSKKAASSSSKKPKKKKKTEAINPRNWESMLARSLGSLCIKLFSNQEEDAEEDEGFGMLASEAAVAQALMLGLPLTTDLEDDDDDDDVDKSASPKEEEEKAEADENKDDETLSDDENKRRSTTKSSKRKRYRFCELSLRYKLAALAVLALGTYGSSKANLIFERRKALEKKTAEERRNDIKAERNKGTEEHKELKEEATNELREEKKLAESSSASNLSAEALTKKSSPEQNTTETETTKTKEPTPAEISRRLELMKDAIILEDRIILQKAPLLDEGVLEDLTDLEHRINSPSFEEESRIRQAELRKELDRKRLRNQDVLDLREDNALAYQERKDILAKLGDINKQASTPYKSAQSTLSSLRALIKRAKKNGLLIGDEGDCNQDKPWCTAEMADALRLVKKLEKDVEDDRQDNAFRTKLSELKVRREPLGRDRMGRIYWWLDDTVLPGHAVPKLPRIFRQSFVPTDNNLNPIETDDMKVQQNKYQKWVCFASKKSLADLASTLSDTHSFERELKHRIFDIFDLYEQFLQEKKSVKQSHDKDGDISMKDEAGSNQEEENPDHVEWQRIGNEFLGRLVLRKFNRSHTEGIVVGWLPPTEKDQALWHIEHSDGDEEDLEDGELQAAIVDHKIAFKKYVNVVSRSNKSSNTFISDYLSGTSIPTIKRGLSDYGYSSTQIHDYLNSLRD